MGAASNDISLYIPVRNAARTLDAAIESVRRQTQTPANFFLLVDLRSSDESVALARRSGLRIVEQHDGRLGHARNLAIQACQTRWLASCDADVTLEPAWLARLAERRTDGVAIVGGCTHERLITAGDRWRAVNMPHNWGPAPLDNPFMLVSEMLADTRALRAVGGYRADLQCWEDSDCCQRLRHAGYTLRYEPGAVAWHDRRDSVEDVLNLRWFYASYRQRQRFESLPGISAKLATNRTYCLQSLSQTLHSEHADTCAVAAALWFHHARKDLAAALDLWPLVDADQRSACFMALHDTLEDAISSDWPQWTPLLRALLPHLWSDSVSRAGRQSPANAANINAWTNLPDSSGFQQYLNEVQSATRALVREWTDPIRDAILSSARRLAALENAASQSAPAFIAPDLTPTVEDRRRISASPAQSPWNDDLLNELLRDADAPPRETLVAIGVDVQHAVSNNVKRLLTTENLEHSASPLAELTVGLSSADWAAIAYRTPSDFIPSIAMLTARDLAACCAAAGFEIRNFYTEAGLTRIIARRIPTRSIDSARENRREPAILT